MTTKAWIAVAALVAGSALPALAENKIENRSGEVLTCESIAVARNTSYCLNGEEVQPVSHSELQKLVLDGDPIDTVR